MEGRFWHFVGRVLWDFFLFCVKMSSPPPSGITNFFLMEKMTIQETRAMFSSSEKENINSRFGYECIIHRPYA
jgi:hypothetical protein